MRIALGMLVVATAFGQTNGSLVLRFVNTAGTQERQAVANSLRAVADVPQAVVDDSAATVALSGSPAQLTLAQWLFRELDQPGTPGTHQYNVPGGTDDIVQVFYLKTPQTPQQLQEIVNAARSITDLQRVVAVNGPKLIAARGQGVRIAAAAWLINDLDQASSPGLHTYGVQMPDRAPLIATVRLANTSSPQTMQEIVNTVRSMADLPRVVVANGPRFLAMRGDPAQIALGEWIIAQLDQKSAPRGVQQYTGAWINWAPGQSARVYFLSHVNTAQSLQDVVNQVRTTAHAQYVLSFPELQAVALRATSAQVAQADQIIAAADQGK